MTQQQLATFAVGSFWGAEALFRGSGVTSIRVGYTGGSTANPTFDEVATNATGHVEAVEVTFDPSVVPYERLLDLFWGLHDPTAVDRFDVDGTRGALRPVVFFHTPEQEKAARATLAELLRPQRWHRPVRTQILPATAFWPAEVVHENYLEERGAYASYVAQQSPQVAATMGGPRVPMIELIDRSGWRREEPNELTDEFGEAFRSHCSDAYVRMALLQDEAHYEAARRALRRWTGVHQHVRASREIDGVRLVAMLPAAQTELRVAARGTELTFLVNHRPGNFAPLTCRGNAVYTQTVASRQSDDGGRVLYRSGAGSGGYAPYVQFDGGTSGPLPFDASVPTDAWYRHLPEMSVDLGCGGAEAHPVRWAGGELYIDAGSGAERERTLAALAGSRCACVAVRDAWQHKSVFPAFGPSGLTDRLRLSIDGGCISPRSGSDIAGWPTEPYRQQRIDRLARLHDVPLPSPADVAGLADPERQKAGCQVWQTLIELPMVLQLRWLLGAITDLDGRRDELDRFDRLHVQKVVLAPIRYSAISALWQWCRCDPAISYGEIDCRCLPPGEEAWADGVVDGDRALITVAISLRWLTEVWARDMAVIEDHLVLHAGGSPSDEEVACRVASWVDGPAGRAARIETRNATARWDGTRWRLT